MRATGGKKESNQKAMKPDTEESLDELVTWYANVFTPQLVNGSNAAEKIMDHNLAVIGDAVSSYRTWRKLRDVASQPAVDALERYYPSHEPALVAARAPIHIDARRFYANTEPQPKKFFRCGNCGKRLPMTSNPETDHHTAQAHRVEDCDKNLQAGIEYRALLYDLKEQHALELEAAAEKQRPWWKVW